MDERDSNLGIGPLLQDFLQATDEADAQSHLGQLIAHVTPDVEKTTKRCRSPEDACQDALKHLTEKLWSLRNNPYSKPIKDFHHYAVRVAANVRRKEWRIEHPQRNGLKDQLRHVLRNDQRFALWDGEDQKQLCGMAEWRSQPLSTNCNERLLRLLADPLECEEALLGGRDAQRLKPAELTEAIFDWVQHTVEFNDDLVDIVFVLKRIEEWEKRDVIEIEKPSDPTQEAEARLRELLECIWAAIAVLEEPDKRAAVLLNLNLAEYGVEVFPLYGVATIRQIGATLQLSDEQFESAWAELDRPARRCAERLTNYDEKFALLWQYLPLKDNVIVRMLGRNRQGVINLRKSAHIHLRRYLAARGFNL